VESKGVIVLMTPTVREDPQNHSAMNSKKVIIEYSWTCLAILSYSNITRSQIKICDIVYVTLCRDDRMFLLPVKVKTLFKTIFKS